MSLKLSGRRHGPHATCDPSAPKPKSTEKIIYVAAGVSPATLIYSRISNRRDKVSF